MNYNEYLDLAVHTIAKNLKPDSQYLTAAAVGGLLRQASPEEDWRAFGKRTLSELLSELEHLGRLSIVKTEKGALAVALGNAASQPSVAIEKFNPLRKSIWDAFVLVSPEGRRFIHRRDGTVRVALDIAPPPADDWAEIFPITTETQINWARDFIAEGHSDKVDLALQTVLEDNWHPQMFARLLKQSDEKLAHLWNRFRSAKVSNAVQEWLTQNLLPSTFAFQSSAKNQPRTVGMQNSIPEIGSAAPIDDSDEARKAILIALSTLPLEKLLEISIPAGVMISALSSAKLR